MSVLICKNVVTEGPGTIAKFLGEAGIPFRVAELSRGDEFARLPGYDALVLLGGPMSVNEADKYPYIRKEEDACRGFIAEGGKVLGICLGAQIMAKALGARVYKNLHKEVGWRPVRLTDEGAKDQRMRRLALQGDSGGAEILFPAFHWHEETFELPEGAVHLAASDLCTNQVFRYGGNAYGFQCHVEVTREMIDDWMKGEEVDGEALRRETELFHDEYRRGAYRFYESFFLNQETGGEK